MLTGTTAETVVLLTLIAVAHVLVTALVTALITRKLTAADAVIVPARRVKASRNRTAANDHIRWAA
jgi:hypothetical protein